MLPFRPDAFVFDLDGVLVDSEPIWRRAEAETVAELGGAYGPEISRLLYGRGHADGGQILADRFGGDPGAIAERLLGHALAGFGDGLEPLPGARELVAGLRGTLPLAVASNSPRPIVEAGLRAVALEDAFDAVICGDEVERPKPAPDPYLAACRALATDPARTVAVEDSPVGVASAKAAGLYAVGVPSERGVELPEADLVVASLAELRAPGR